MTTAACRDGRRVGEGRADGFSPRFIRCASQSEQFERPARLQRNGNATTPTGGHPARHQTSVGRMQRVEGEAGRRWSDRQFHYIACSARAALGFCASLPTHRPLLPAVGQEGRERHPNTAHSVAGEMPPLPPTG